MAVIVKSAGKDHRIPANGIFIYIYRIHISVSGGRMEVIGSIGGTTLC